MATTYQCDAVDCVDEETGGPARADVLVTTLEDGSVAAWCHRHYAEIIVAIAQQLAEAGAELERQAAAEAEAEAEETARQAAARLEAVDAPAEPFPGTEHVEPRGQSRSRRAYEARKRAKDRKAAGTADATAELDDEPAEPAEEAATAAT